MPRRPAGGPVIEVEVAPSTGALAGRAARRVAELAAEAIADRGLFTLAVSGGSTPARMFAELAAQTLPWERIHLFQVDERVAPEGHPDRNLTGLQANLLGRVDLPPGNVHLMPVTAEDLRAAADEYAGELRAVCGEAPALDLVHLGLGDDGHTASWAPRDPVMEVADRDVAVVGPYRRRLRMTLTPPAVNRARRVLWLVSGEGKAHMLKRLLAGDPVLPAARVQADRALVLADPAAAAHIAAG